MGTNARVKTYFLPHLEKYLRGEGPSSFLPANKIGKAIWNSDENHEVIMHPIIRGDDGKSVHVFVHLFRRFHTSDQYSSLAHSLLKLVQGSVPQANLISIVFYFRAAWDAKFLADLQWTNDGLIFYKDELKKDRNFFTPIFALFYKLSRTKQKRE